MIAWTIGDSAAADIRTARSSDRGATFSLPSIVATTSARSDAPKLAFDIAGNLHLAWAEHRGGHMGPATIQYARSLDGARTFNPARDLSVPSLTARNTYPMLAIDGEVIVVNWELGASNHAMSRGLAIPYATDGGRASRGQRSCRVARTTAAVGTAAIRGS